MNNFTLYNPTKIVFGKNVIKQLGTEVYNFGVKKVLILAGGGSIKNNGVYDSVCKSLHKAGIEYEELWGVRPNPTLEHARIAIDIIKKSGIEGIIAVGGGSVIDEAKAVAAGPFLDDIWDAYTRKVIISNALPIFTVLTISATGSEMNYGSVLSNDEEQIKCPLHSSHYFPKVSFIDPSVQMSLPWHQTVNGGIDAMIHTMEYYFVGSNSETTIAIDEAIIKTIIQSVDNLMQYPNDYGSRASLAWAATIALNGVSGAGMNGGDWATHMIEHAISALHTEVAHGAGLAVIMPAWIKYNSNLAPEQFKRWAKKIWDCDDIDTAIDKMKVKFRTWGSPVSLRDLNIEETEIPAIADKVLVLGAPGQLKRLEREDLINILKIAF